MVGFGEIIKSRLKSWKLDSQTHGKRPSAAWTWALEAAADRLQERPQRLCLQSSACGTTIFSLGNGLYVLTPGPCHLTLQKFTVSLSRFTLAV